jgi:hypothetical protein
VVPAARPAESAGRSRDKVATCDPADGEGDAAKPWPTLDKARSEAVRLDVGALETGSGVSGAGAKTGGTDAEISDDAGTDQPRSDTVGAELDAARGAGADEAETTDAAAAIDATGLAAAVTGGAFAGEGLVGDGAAAGWGAMVSCACKAVVKPCGMTADGVSVARLDPRDAEDTGPGTPTTDDDALDIATAPARLRAWAGGPGEDVDTLSEETL